LQTEEMCLRAVNQDGILLAYAHYQNENICLAAIKQDAEAF
jgi:hypothetical protein